MNEARQKDWDQVLATLTEPERIAYLLSSYWNCDLNTARDMGPPTSRGA